MECIHTRAKWIMDIQHMKYIRNLSKTREIAQGIQF